MAPSAKVSAVGIVAVLICGFISGSSMSLPRRGEAHLHDETDQEERARAETCALLEPLAAGQHGLPVIRIGNLVGSLNPFSFVVRDVRARQAIVAGQSLREMDGLPTKGFETFARVHE